MSQDTSNLVNVAWLDKHLNDPAVLVLDASWYMPADERSGDVEFTRKHIPGSQRFDFDGVVVDEHSDLPHTLPAPEKFQSIARTLGINNETHLVVYDGSGVFAAPRVWWMFKVMGHQRVSLLNGGLPAWEAAKLELASGRAKTRKTGNFNAVFQAKRYADASLVKQSLSSKSHQILDARGNARFTGEEAEPREGLRSGHMPGAQNLHFRSLINNEHLVDADAIQQVFAGAGLTDKRPVISSCGSGVTAAILALAAEHAGLGVMAVYDGSWSEWGLESRPELPVEKGPASGQG